MLGWRFSGWRLEAESGSQIEWLRLALRQCVPKLNFPVLVPKMTDEGYSKPQEDETGVQ